MANYIFITEGGAEIFHTETVTPHDIACVNAGILTIIRISDLKELRITDSTELESTNNWVEIAKGVLCPNPDLGEFHTYPDVKN